VCAVEKNYVVSTFVMLQLLYYYWLLLDTYLSYLEVSVLCQHSFSDFPHDLPFRGSYSDIYFVPRLPDESSPFHAHFESTCMAFAVVFLALH